jgi:hypothetical protein
MLAYERALQHELASPAARELLAKVERGELSLHDLVIRQIAATLDKATGDRDREAETEK